MEGDNGVEVVSVAPLAVVNRGGAGAVLAPLVGHKFALLERGPVSVEVSVHLGVGSHVVVDLGVCVGALAARGVPTLVVGPEAVDGDAAGEPAGAGGQEAAAVVAEGALPGLRENHVGPLVLGLVSAARVHVPVVAAVERIVGCLRSADDAGGDRKSYDRTSLHYVCSVCLFVCGEKKAKNIN